MTAEGSSEAEQLYLNNYAVYKPEESLYGEDRMAFCSGLFEGVPAEFIDEQCCLSLDRQHRSKHCGPVAADYLVGGMSWDHGTVDMVVAAEDAAKGYRFFPDECADHTLKLKPKWQEVDLESDDWRLSALVRLLAGVEGDYHDLSATTSASSDSTTTTYEFRFETFLQPMVEGSTAAPAHLDYLPKTWRGFPVYVNPTCSDQQTCSFVYIWVATHTLIGEYGTSDRGRAVVSRSHPALVYWRALTEPRDFWECDAFGDQCKYDMAHPDDCIDHVTFPIGGVEPAEGRGIVKTLASESATWRSELRGAVVFSEVLFGARPKAASIDVIDGFEVNCDAGASLEPTGANASEGKRVVNKDDEGDIEEESRVLETMGQLFDTMGPAALPLMPLVVLYVAFDEITNHFVPEEAKRNSYRTIDMAFTPFVRVFDFLFASLYS